MTRQRPIGICAPPRQQPNVVYALGTMYLAGEGVQKDYLRAYVLCNVGPGRGQCTRAPLPR